MRRELARDVTLLACIAAAGGCPESRHITDADGDGRWETVTEVVMPAANKVDILFMVDNSNSMSEEQEVLAAQGRVLIEELISPTTPGVPAVDDLHIGVVTSDMGTSGYRVQTCNNPMTGNNGVLQNRDHGIVEGCQRSYSAADCDRGVCPWLSHSDAHPDDRSDPANGLPIWEDFGCIATLGTGGCGFEQPLEASLAALTVQAAPGMPNEGFLRDDSLLVIIYVTDEDDCSTGNPEMFDQSREDLGGLNIRCVLNPDELYPISRYHDAFVALRGGLVDRVVVAAIAGVPVDGSWDPGDPIDQLRELQRVNPDNPNELVPTCGTFMGHAYAPVRIAELVYSFGASGHLSSICREDWTGALQAVTRGIQRRVSTICAGESADITTSRCRMVAVQAGPGACPNLADAAGPERTRGWEADLGLDESGHRLCEILTADYDGDGSVDSPGGLQGWYFASDERCTDGAVRLTTPDLAAGAAELRIECRPSGD